MQNFQFHRPATVADAIHTLENASEGKLMAGGQSLLPVLKLELAAFSDIVSLSGIEDLMGIGEEGDALVMGAAVTHAEVADSSLVSSKVRALAVLAGGIGDPQVRNRGTIGGSLAHGDPAADYPAALVALGATVVTDQREIHADDFFTGLFETALSENEVITSVRFPVPGRAAYAKFPHPASKYAIVGVMVAEGPGGIRVAVTGAGPKVFRVHEMESALNNDFSTGAVENIAVDAEAFFSDADASAGYRAHLVNVMARRAVSACA